MAGTTISSAWANNTLSDIASGLSTCLLKDGSQTVTANIPMGGFKFTGLAAGTAAGNSLRYEQGLQSILTTTGDTIQTTSANTAARLAATATVAAHATTCDVWTARETILSGSAVTFTDIADAPYAGAVAWVKMNAAHIWTQGAVFTVQGGATYTTAANDWVRIEAITVSTFSVTIFPVSGMPVQQTRYKIGSFTYDSATASGTTAVTGVGFTPKIVRFMASVMGSAKSSHGVDDGAVGKCMYSDDNTTADTWGMDGAFSIFIESGGGANSKAVISSMDSDGFTITRTKTGSPTGTVTVFYEASR